MRTRWIPAETMTGSVNGYSDDRSAFAMTERHHDCTRNELYARAPASTFLSAYHLHIPPRALKVLTA
jgi:hypothetical protein